MSGRCRSYIQRFVFLVVLLVVALGFSVNLPSEARKKSGSSKHSSHAKSSKSSHSSHVRSGRSGGRHGRHEVATSKHGKHGKHHAAAAHHHHHVAHKPRYAYPVEMFMMKAPEFDASPLDEDQAYEVKSAFARGIADKFPARTLVRAGVVKHHPLRGGIFWRREPVKYIVMHSTETGIPVSGVRVIESWSSMGRRHPGAQYVVDRDGSIIQSVDPDLATVHINILKTLPGINNDNSIGIEMNHTGSQEYPEAQLQSVIRLVTYLQDRYGVQSENIITHRYAQQGDHTDPVHFDWKGFLWSKDRHRNEAIAYKMNSIEKQARNWGDYKESPAVAEPPPNTILQPHMTVQGKPLPASAAPSATPPESNAPSPPSKAPVVMFDVVKPTEPVKGPSGFTPSVIVPVQSSPSVPPSTNVPSATNAPAVITAPSAMPPQRNETVSPHGLPPLRGPIEVGPEHAGELSVPRQ